MTVARIRCIRHNENAPTVGSGWGAETEPSWLAWAMLMSNSTGSFCTALTAASTELCHDNPDIFTFQARGSVCTAPRSSGGLCPGCGLDAEFHRPRGWGNSCTSAPARARGTCAGCWPRREFKPRRGGPGASGGPTSWPWGGLRYDAARVAAGYRGLVAIPRQFVGSPSASRSAALPGVYR